MSEVVYLSNVRLSFPKLVEASISQPGAEPKFSCDLIMPNNDAGFAKFMGAVGKMATEKWKEHAQAVLQICQNDRKLRCYGQGNEKIDKKTYKPYLGYENMSYITASSNADRPPKIVRADGTPIDNSNTMERQQMARKLYGGCYVNVAVRPWPQDNQFGRAPRCELIAVQFASDGEPFGEGEVDLDGVFGAVQETPELPPFM
jgi:hypothetical protein